MSHSTRKDGPGCAQRRRRVHGTSTPNGRRSSFRDWAAEATDHPREVVEAAYRRSDLFERRRPLMDDWAAYLAGGTGWPWVVSTAPPPFSPALFLSTTLSSSCLLPWLAVCRNS